MSNMKCQHEWEYFDDHDFPNGYEYEQVNIPHKRCKKCGREYELFDGYGEYAKRWRKVEYWSPELHKLEKELADTKKKLDVCEECCREWETDYHLEFEKSTRLENRLKDTKKKLDIAVDALKWIAYDENDEQDGLEEFAISQMVEKADKAIEQITAHEQKDVK